ncbi:hypothetical protein [Plastoroseomonas arctica]|uniref:Uncharacterized protein n=1 Tax=Plastoroseomonas arctica TaxID=1509237 RepID=A0AAF1K563_9PROT|nr:hypothetical protein [Plastoroseomonas arctica]MBR0656090.1 hypothetical protein [Plastoroseomonas arctica]
MSITLRAVPRFVVTGLLRHEPALSPLGLILLAATLPTLFAMAIDVRQFGAASVWLKPFKFQLSLGVHVLTVALALAALDPAARQGRTARIAITAMIAAVVFEAGYITLQGALGLPSHFAPGLVGGILYGLMGLGATAIVLATATLGGLILRRPAAGVPGTLRLAAGSGLLVSGALGLVTGFAISLSQGPIVGEAGGAGVALFGWSRSAGDLRVAHFIALHAAQGLPLLGLLLRETDPRIARGPLILAACLWSALALGAMLQALAGIPAFPMP